jgi:outer membrane protein OmpA-like peptidoglycan-associated protein
MVAVTGCAGVQMQQNVYQVRLIAKEARDNGAYRCAPRQLALAEVNIDFADAELGEGDYFRAREHLQIADDNAREAYRLSPRDRCVPSGDKDKDGIPDNVDKCPDQPEDKDGFQDEDGCPDPDNDNDGIPDNVDLCPNDPEDKDGFEDQDGCPDPDNDHDRIPDKDDKCPNEPETYNGYQDEDGCPDRGRVVVTDTSIEILDVIYFEYDKAVILSKSYPILDAVAATLQGNPSIQLVEIQGHTDERGDDAYNLDLSDRRAKAVMKYLVDKGVDSKRLTAQGYGETQPLDRRHIEAAWAKNRRVAFLIIKRATD